MYTGASVNSLSLVADNDDFDASNTSAVTFAATSGTTYHVALDGFDGEAGVFYLDWAAYNDNSPEFFA